MECIEFRERLLADPSSVDEAMAAHERGCSACRAYAVRVREAEVLIGRALRFDVVAAAAVSAPARQPAIWPSVAAGVVVTIALWFGYGTARPPSDAALVAGLVEHVMHEPDSWLAREAAVPARRLQDVLARKASVRPDAATRVTYAKSCRIAGQWMSHLVVQSSAGPVMLMLIPERHFTRGTVVSVPEHGLDGRMLDLPSGSIAVLGADAAALDEVERDVAPAVDFSI